MDGWVIDAYLAMRRPVEYGSSLNSRAVVMAAASVQYQVGIAPEGSFTCYACLGRVGGGGVCVSISPRG